MFKRGIEGFPYFLGVSSLDKLATRDDRVCVLNIVGGESRQVTPVSRKSRLLSPSQWMKFRDLNNLRWITGMD